MPRLPRPRAPRAPELVADLGRLAADLAQEAWDRWLELSIYTRRRLGVLLGLCATVALLWLVAVPALPCWAPGGDACGPADRAIDLVPADALAYAHLDLQRSEQLDAAQRLGAQLPALSRAAVGRLVRMLPGPHGATLDFGRDIRPWLGGEAALAVLPAGRRVAQEVQLLSAADERGARAYAAAIASGPPRATTDRGVEVEVDRRGLATALVRGFLAIGTRRGVGEVIDTATGAAGADSLAGDGVARDARAALPDQRLADLYLSRQGVARLVSGPRAPLAALATLIDPGASRGAAAALAASGTGLELQVHSVLDPTRARAHPSILSALPAFDPSLAGSLSPDSLGYLGVGNPGEAIGALAGLATSGQPGLAAAFGELAKRVPALRRLDLERELAPALGDEAAFALTPSGASGPPALAFVASGIDASRAAAALDRLKGGVARALGSARGFVQRKEGDLTVHSLRVSSGVDLTYAIVDSDLVIATDPAGVRAVSAGAPGLGDGQAFQDATAGFPDEVSTLAYLNLDGLLALGERAGLTRNPAYQAFAPELQELRALGFAAQSAPDQLSTYVRLVVGPG